MSTFKRVLASRLRFSEYVGVSGRGSGDTSENDTALKEVKKSLLGSETSTHPNLNHRHNRCFDIACTIIGTLMVVALSQVIFNTYIYTSQARFSNAIEKVYGEEERVRNDLDPLYHCGNSSTEAIAQGCIFDMSVLGWVPTPCYDSMIHQRFMDFGWRFFEDQNATIEVSVDRLAESAGTREPFWVQHGFHVTHCELAWQRMHRAIQIGGRLTTHLLNFEHTHHCGMILETRTDLMEINSQILPLLNTC